MLTGLGRRGAKHTFCFNIFICLLNHVYEASFANMKKECRRWPEKKTVKLKLWSTFSRILRQRIKHF